MEQINNYNPRLLLLYKEKSIDHLKNVLDIKKVLAAGADRVCINSAAIKNPDFISNAAEVFGSSTICVNIQTLRDKRGRYYCYYNHGRELTNIDVESWAKIAEKKGATASSCVGR